MCMHMYKGVGLTPPILTPTHPLAAKGGNPLKQYKFNMSWTKRDKWILFVDLKSV